jgi:hypothetical protein
MYARRVGGLAHFAAESINLPHDVPFGNAANRRIARHPRDRGDVYCQEQSVHAETSRRKRGFASRMTRSDNYDVTVAHMFSDYFSSHAE